MIRASRQERDLAFAGTRLHVRGSLFVGEPDRNDPPFRVMPLLVGFGACSRDNLIFFIARHIENVQRASRTQAAPALLTQSFPGAHQHVKKIVREGLLMSSTKGSPVGGKRFS